MAKLFYDEQLSNLILNEIPSGTKKITIISGYIGPTLIEKLLESIQNNINLKQVKIKIFIGMYGKGISLKLHEKLLDLNNQYNNLNIYYTNKLVHTKMYLYQDEKNFYLNKLIGSANFSTTLYIDKKEILTVARQNEEIVNEIEKYCKWVFKNSTDIKSFIPKKEIKKKEVNFLNHKIIDKRRETKISLKTNIAKKDKEHFKIPIFFKKHIPLYNLNRNFYSVTNKTSNIIIPLNHKIINKIIKFDNYNEDIWNLKIFEIIWDDGTCMLAEYEGIQKIDNKIYPLGIVSKNPSELEEYLKKRIENQLKTKLNKISSKILDIYGNKTIILSYINKNIFYLSFKTKSEYKQIRKLEKKQKTWPKIKRLSKEENIRGKEKITKDKVVIKKRKEKIAEERKKNKKIFKIAKKNKGRKGHP